MLQRVPLQHQYTLRGLRFHLYEWPGTGTPWVWLHGWGDTAATFQFMVEHLGGGHRVIAPDQRGFGRTQWAGGGYWFPDYLADLDALLEQLSPHAPVHLLGHSMGGNIAMLYAGIRPDRVCSVVSLEGFGLPPSQPQQAPERYARWLEQWREPPAFAVYRDFDHFVATLARRNPRTPPAHLEFIARAWGRQRQDGSIELRADPAHKRVNPVLYQFEQAQACWSRIQAPVLWVIGECSAVAQPLQDPAWLQQLSAPLADLSIQRIAQAGHMMHHEQPAQVAALIEAFLGSLR